jgi:peptidoglycan hydrolase-like protein with peptidoglycan-binding domain
MRKYLLFIVLVLFSIYMFGCGKKQQALEETQEPMSMEALSTITTTAPTAPKAPVSASPVVTPPVLEPLPPAGPYKPTAVEIQTALKNAGYYTEGIDGKLGPKTKKAIEEFQKANALKVDGKIGPKTWSVLSKYLNPQPAPTTPGKKR